MSERHPITFVPVYPAQSMSRSVLSVHNLDLQLGTEQILHNISCDIPKGKVTVVVGPSGAGKSSLLKCFTRLLPGDGQIFYLGQPIIKINIQQLRKNVIYVSQVPVVFPGSVTQNINWGREVWSLDDIDVEEQLELVGLSSALADRDASDLSVGQQQRLHLARSLALDPAVLLLDEPASSLDAISKEAFEKLISELQRTIEGLSVVMITHDLNQAQRMAEYVILLHNGEKKLEYDADQFFEEVKDLSEADMLETLLATEEQNV